MKENQMSATPANKSRFAIVRLEDRIAPSLMSSPTPPDAADYTRKAETLGVEPPSAVANVAVTPDDVE